MMTYRIAGCLLSIAAVTLALLILIAQAPFANANFEFGKYQTYAGPIVKIPFPALEDSGRLIPLVGTGKHGADALFDAGASRFSAARIYRGAEEMLEVDPASVRATAPLSQFSLPARQSLERIVLSGEVADSKCFLGVMNPGAGRVHRECAVRCLSGGVPAIFVARDSSGVTQILWLVDQNGRALSREVLPFVALPVRIEGQLLRRANLTFFAVDPSSIRRE